MQALDPDSGRARTRYTLLAVLFAATAVSYADRASLSIAGSALQKEMHIDAVTLGYVFSAFGWAYVVAQIPSGWLLDRFGSRRIYIGALLSWSLFTMFQGAVGLFTSGLMIAALFVFRLMVGVAEGPAFPGNSRLVSAWFPTTERGTASAIFNSAQYVAIVVFAPLMAWITDRLGWRSVFIVMGLLGIGLVFLCLRTIYDPREHPRLRREDIEYLARRGALIDVNRRVGAVAAPLGLRLRHLLTNRMLIGVYIGQYCITTLTYFFLTWFPIYLVQQRGMSIFKAGLVASLPAVCGFIGGVLGGLVSDALLRAGHSLTVARKVPIVGGMLLSIVMVVCNYVQSDWLVVLCMSLAFFGKGIGALGWAVVADTSPTQMVGLSGALFNTFGNVAAITTPIVIGYIVSSTGSFEGALVFVGANALVAIVSYLTVVGTIRRVEWQPPQALAPVGAARSGG